MDTAVAIRTLEATYKQSADSVAVESMIAKLTEKVVSLRQYMIYWFHPALSKSILWSQSEESPRVGMLNFTIKNDFNRVAGMTNLEKLLFQDAGSNPDRDSDRGIWCGVV